MASRVYLNGDAVLMTDLTDHVSLQMFADLRELFEDCDGRSTFVVFGELRASIRSDLREFGLPKDAFGFEAVITTPMLTERRLQIFAATDDDCLLTVSLLYPTSTDTRNEELFVRAIEVARGG